MIRFNAAFNYNIPFRSGRTYNKKLWEHIIHQIGNKTPILRPGYYPCTIEDMTSVDPKDIIGYIDKSGLYSWQFSIGGYFLDTEIANQTLGFIKDGKYLMLSPYGFGTRFCDPIKGPDYVLKGFNSEIIDEMYGTGMVELIEEEK